MTKIFIRSALAILFLITGYVVYDRLIAKTDEDIDIEIMNSIIGNNEDYVYETSMLQPNSAESAENIKLDEEKIRSLVLDTIKNNSSVIEDVINEVVDKKLEFYKSKKEEKFLKNIDELVKIGEKCPYVVFNGDHGEFDSNNSSKKEAEDFDESNTMYLISEIGCLNCRKQYLNLTKEIKASQHKIKLVFLYNDSGSEDAKEIIKMLLSVNKTSRKHFLGANDNAISNFSLDKSIFTNYLAKHNIKIDKKTIESNDALIEDVNKFFDKLDSIALDLPILLFRGQVYLESLTKDKIREIISE